MQREIERAMQEYIEMHPEEENDLLLVNHNVDVIQMSLNRALGFDDERSFSELQNNFNRLANGTNALLESGGRGQDNLNTLWGQGEEYLRQLKQQGWPGPLCRTFIAHVQVIADIWKAAVTVEWRGHHQAVCLFQSAFVIKIFVF